MSDKVTIAARRSTGEIEFIRAYRDTIRVSEDGIEWVDMDGVINGPTKDYVAFKGHSDQVTEVEQVASTVIAVNNLRLAGIVDRVEHAQVIQAADRHLSEIGSSWDELSEVAEGLL